MRWSEYFCLPIGKEKSQGNRSNHLLNSIKRFIQVNNTTNKKMGKNKVLKRSHYFIYFFSFQISSFFVNKLFNQQVLLPVSFFTSKLLYQESCIPVIFLEPSFFTSKLLMSMIVFYCTKDVSYSTRIVFYCNTIVLVTLSLSLIWNQL